MKLLSLAALIEALTGFVLIASPALLARLLFGGDISPDGEAVGRVAGFALVSLGLACWPLRSGSNARAIRGLLAYNVLATLFFIYLGVRGELVGKLLWPAAALHAILSVLVARIFVASRAV